MKYHQKINLASPIFKYTHHKHSKSPSKSPLKSSINPSQLFQKVCCPNCKYAFKIIKQDILKDNPPESSTSKLKSNKKQQKQTQTQGILTINNNNSPIKFLKAQPRFYQPQQGIQNSRKSQFSRLNDILQAQNIETKYLKDTEFKFTPLSVSPKNKKSKSHNLLKTLGSEKYSKVFPIGRQIDRIYKQVAQENLTNESNQIIEKDSQYTKQKNPIQKEISSQKQSNLKQYQNNVISINNSEGQKQSLKSMSQKNLIRKPTHNSQLLIQIQAKQSSKNTKLKLDVKNNKNDSSSNISLVQKLKFQSQFSSLVNNIAIKNIQNQQIIKQLQLFCQNVSQEVQVPSYCKMLSLLD